MPPPIRVDDAFMGRVETTCRQLGTDILATPQGPLSNFQVRAGGPAFTLGAEITQRVATMTTGVSTRLSDLATNAGNRAAQISTYRLVTDDAEVLNDMSAQDFLSDVPNWGPGATRAPNTP